MGDREVAALKALISTPRSSPWLKSLGVTNKTCHPALLASASPLLLVLGARQCNPLLRPRRTPLQIAPPLTMSKVGALTPTVPALPVKNFSKV